MAVKFKAKIIKPELIGAMNYVQIPFDPKHEFGKPNNYKVKGKINNIEFDNLILTNIGDGSYIMNLKDALMARAKTKIGEIASFEIELDQYESDIPIELLNALEKDYMAKDFFYKLSIAHKSNFLIWIKDAKSEKTQMIRISKAIEMLRNQKKFGE